MLMPSDIVVEKKFHFTGHAAGVFALEGGLKPDTVLSGGGDGVIAEWNLDGNGDAEGLARVPGNIFALLLMADKGLVMAGDLYGGVYVIDTATRQEVNRFSWDGAAVYAFLRLDDDRVAIGSGTGNLIIRNINSHTTEQVINIGQEAIRSLVKHPTLPQIALGCSDNCVHILDADTLKTITVLHGHVNSVFSVQYHPNGKHLLSGARDAQIRIWDVVDGYSCLQTLPAHMFTVNDIKFHPDGHLFASAGRDKHVKIWDAKTYALLKVIDKEKYDGHINSVNKLFWSKWQNTLISCGDDRTVMGWGLIS